MGVLGLAVVVVVVSSAFFLPVRFLMADQALNGDGMFADYSRVKWVLW